MKLLRGLLAISVLLLAFAGLESVLERFYYSRTFNYYQAANVYWEDQHTLLLYLPHRTLFWSLRPSIHLKAAAVTSAPHLRPEWSRETRYAWEIQVGSNGFRGPSFPAVKPAGELRVVCLGDSRTMGEGLQEPETYAAQLQGDLRALGQPTARVLNLGHDGWSSYQGLRLFETQAVDFSPDVAVFSFGVNDTDADLGISDRKRAPLVDSAFVSIQRTLYRSMSFYWAQRQFLAARGWLFGKRRVTGQRRGRGPSRTPRVSPDEFEANLRAFVTLARRRNVIPILLIIPPNPYYDWSEWTTGRSAEVRQEKQDFAEAIRLREHGDRAAAQQLFMKLVPTTAFEELNRVVRRVAESEGAPLVDLSATFFETLQREQLYIDDVHPNREGSDLIARLLAEAIVPQLAARRASEQH